MAAMRGAGRLDRWHGPVLGLLAAALFGVSAPLAKLLLAEADPFVLAGLLYLGGGLALAALRGLRRGAAPAGREAPLGRADLPLLGAIAAVGGMAGPVLMLVGLTRVSGVAGALLLNLEAPLTILLAVAWFGEHLGRREVGAAALVSAGAGVLAWAPSGLRADAIGVLALAGACACWAIDNNLVQRLTLRDPVAVARAKALVAGSATLLLALSIGRPLPAPGVVGMALALGAASFGASIVLDTYALRLLGAAREAAYFATAPFVGALLAVPILGESLGVREAGAGLVMALGVALLLRERHSHEHVHDEMEHEHLHVHDEHHRHEHGDGVAGGEPHAHPHRHEPLRHAHPHVSDAHHRHPHR
jgi:drug/metabolite transporter (DMT)-like permease